MDLLNECWDKERLPTDFEEAHVITIYKKGDLENPGNYRPISLLNSLYKVYAAIIKHRLSDCLEDKISPTQSGFIAKRSTIQPIFATRRIQDVAEKSGEQCILTFLDWEKAFDKADQQKMLVAISRLNLPQKINKILASFYICPR